MPEIVLFSRRWHATTDTMPFPLAFGALFHASFLIVYGALIGAYDIWDPCPGQGSNYIAVTGALMTIFFLELCLELAMIYVGLKGKQLDLCALSFLAAHKLPVSSAPAASLWPLTEISGKPCPVLTKTRVAGAPLQVSVRKSVDTMMYGLVFCWLLQTIFMSELALSLILILILHQDVWALLPLLRLQSDPGLPACS